MTKASIRRDFAVTEFEEARALLTWNYLVEPGDRIAGELINQLGAVDALEVFINRKSLGEEIDAAFERWAPRYKPNLVDEKISAAKTYDLKLLLPSDSQWPSSLRDLGSHAPMLLWYRGNIEVFAKLNRAVGVVGSRNATHYGQRVTSDLSAMLVEEGAAVISGGALGIDSVAHRTTLNLGGTTVAFMAGAIDSPYPSGNLRLFDEIAHKGLLLSEMTPCSRPTRWRFLQRNRLISALSNALVVTEAGWRSGSINTVSHAGELNRPVFAVPGPISSPASAGCNRLIRDQRASLLLDLSELPSELGWRNLNNTEKGSLGSLELRTIDVLTTREQSLESLLVASGLSVGELRVALGSLKLLGRVNLGPNGGWKKSETF